MGTTLPWTLNQIDLAHQEFVTDKFARILRYQDAGAVRFICAFEAGSQIYRIADHREVTGDFRTNCTDDHFATGNTDAQIYVEAVGGGTQNVSDIFAEADKMFETVQRGPAS